MCPKLTWILLPKSVPPRFWCKVMMTPHSSSCLGQLSWSHPCSISFYHTLQPVMRIVARTSLETKDPVQVRRVCSVPAQGREGLVWDMSLWRFLTLSIKGGSRRCPENGKQVTCKKCQTLSGKGHSRTVRGRMLATPASRTWPLFD